MWQILSKLYSLFRRAENSSRNPKDTIINKFNRINKKNIKNNKIKKNSKISKTTRTTTYHSCSML